MVTDDSGQHRSRATAHALRQTAADELYREKQSLRENIPFEFRALLFSTGCTIGLESTWLRELR